MRPAAKLKLAALGTGVLLLTLWPQVGLSAARQGLVIWAGALVPALFPYCFLAIALQRGGLGRLLGRRLGRLARALGCPADGAGAIVCGWLGGNPTGAALTAICTERGGARAEYLRLAWVSSACSPAFALGALEQALPGAGWTLLVSSWLGILFGALPLRLLTARAGMAQRLGDIAPVDAGPAGTGTHVSGRAASSSSRAGSANSASPVRATLVAPERSAASNAASPALEAARATLLVGCWVVLFSVLSAYMYLATLLIAPGLPPLVPACLHALLEMAGGCLTLAELPGAHVLPLICFAITFGGLSIAMQALSLLRPAGIPAGPYLMGKAVQGACAALICALLARAGAVEAFAHASEALPAPPTAPVALAALVLAVVAALMNRRYIAWDDRNSALKAQQQGAHNP